MKKYVLTSLLLSFLFSLNLLKAQPVAPNLTITDGNMIAGGYYQIPVNFSSNEDIVALEATIYSSDGLIFGFQNGNNNTVTLNEWYWNSSPIISYDPNTDNKILHWGLVSGDSFSGNFKIVRIKARTDGTLQDSSTVYTIFSSIKFIRGDMGHSQYNTFSPYATKFTIFNNGILGGNQGLLDVVRILDIVSGKVVTNTRESTYYDLDGSLSLTSYDALLKMLRYFNMIYSYPVEIGYDYFNGYGSIVPSGEILVQQQLNQILLKLPKNTTNGDLKFNLPKGAWIENTYGGYVSINESKENTKLSFINNPNKNLSSIVIHGVKNLSELTVSGSLNKGIPVIIKPLITGVENKNSVPIGFNLSQNYPNPFNPTTNIKFDLPKESNVTLKVYNTIGEEVVTLVNEVKPAGNYEVKFDASGLASGTYIYKLTAGDIVQTKKMILLK